MRRWLGNPIVVAMVLGLLTGYGLNRTLDADAAAKVAGYLSILTDIFLRLIRMIIAPLVLSTLIVGIARMGDGSALGRVGARTFAWFIGASLLSLVLGLLMVNTIAPGLDLGLPLPEAASGVQTSAFTLRDFVTHLVPRSVIEAM